MTRQVRSRSRQSRPQGSRVEHSLETKKFSGLVQALKQFESRGIVDPFDHHKAVAGSVHTIAPPFNPAALLRMPVENNTLGQCIDAMKTNVVGHGWSLEYVGPDGEEDTEPAREEKRRLTDLLAYPADDTSLEQVLDRLATDLYSIGNLYLEVIRDQAARTVTFGHLPAHTMRLTPKDTEAVAVTVPLVREGEIRKVSLRKHFRRYVQMVGGKRVFFKEFGDPRTINPKTGEADDTLPVSEGATEVIHVPVYYPGSAYGLPRWVNQIPSVIGSRQAELTNMDFFNDNAIPALAVLVSGGQVSQSTINEIESQLAAARGRSSMNRVMIIEARGDDRAASEQGQVPAPRMELKPLRNDRQQDALFLEYDASAIRKIRSAFRLPPIFIGLSDDYSHATAKTSYEVAEGQVFGPERELFNSVINLRLLASHEPRFWRFRLNGAQITDQKEMVEAARAFEELGAMTPNVAIALANEMFGFSIPSIEDEWGKFPFSLIRQQSSAVPGLEAAQDGISGALDPGDTDNPDNLDDDE